MLRFSECTGAAPLTFRMQGVLTVGAPCRRFDHALLVTDSCSLLECDQQQESLTGPEREVPLTVAWQCWSSVNQKAHTMCVASRSPSSLSFWGLFMNECVSGCMTVLPFVDVSPTPRVLCG